jgi:uncharacterized protein YgbK (DUF1537 family)
MKPLRLVADDLTGALDASAQFSGPERAIPVFMDPRLPAAPPEEFAVDGATREKDGPSAGATAGRLAPILALGPGVLSFKKLDSLLRGHPGLEIAATMRAVTARHCLIAPAFPFHGRATRGGLQFLLSDGMWSRVGEDLLAVLRSFGISAQLRKPGEPVPEGISLWDAETDEDLRRIVVCGKKLHDPVLWCGSGGLAAALSDSASNEIPAARLDRPMLGIFGSDHPATGAQLAACGNMLRLRACGDAEARSVSERLEKDGVCLVSFELPSGLARPEASRRIARETDELMRRIPAPRSLLVAGGATLRTLCLSLGADHLRVVGQVIPGVPVSLMAGGRWDGVQVISKSGAFGDDGLLLRLISGASAGQNGSTPTRG